MPAWKGKEKCVYDYEMMIEMALGAWDKRTEGERFWGWNGMG